MTEIYIATHKRINFDLPPIYKWVQVNAEKNGLWEGYLHDSDGENISYKNDSYCELTALFRLWKHSTAEIQGLCHYRRFLGKRTSLSLEEVGDRYFFRKNQIARFVIQENNIIKILEHTDVLLARDLFPYPFTAFEDLQRFVYLKDIATMVTVFEEYYPNYIDALREVLSSTNLSYCNLFIAKKEFIDQYCSWLFPLLDRIERKTDISHYDKNHKRIYGYLAEVLLNVYIKKNRIRFKTLDVVKLNECCNGFSLKRRIWLFNEKIRSVLGLFPLIHDYAINKARYEWLKHHKHPIFPFTINDLYRYYMSLDGKEISVESDEYGIEKLFACFYSFSLLSFIAKNKNQLSHIYKDAEQFLEGSESFEKTRIVRAYCLFSPTAEDYIYAMKKGVMLFSSNGS